MTNFELIKNFEGFSAKAYYCPAGVLTIGYGTTHYANGKSVKPDDTITEEQAEKELKSEVDKISAALALKVHTWKLLNDNQKEAVISFAYNFGPAFYGRPGFGSISKLLRTSADWVDAAEVRRVFGLYCKANGKILLGLEKRRLAEANLFLGLS